MLAVSSLTSILKIVVLSSVIFVWVVRYQNIIEEFKFYKYPNWLRDIVGILKISFVILIVSSDPFQVQVGSAGIALLMLAALFTHFRVKNPFQKMLPSLSLLVLSCLIFLSGN